MAETLDELLENVLNDVDKGFNTQVSETYEKISEITIS